MKGKEKVAVLDFVANIDRIKQVAKLTKEIERFGGAQAQEKENHTLGTPLHVEGNGFRFDFSDQVVNLLSVFERLEQDFIQLGKMLRKHVGILELKQLMIILCFTKMIIVYRLNLLSIM